MDLAAFILISAFVVVNALWVYRRHFRYRDLQMDQVDAMAGEEFEHFCGYLLKRNGYKHIKVTQASGDQGIDIIAEKMEKRVDFSASGILDLLVTRPFKKFGRVIISINSTKQWC